jgi:hypothetical protein
VLVTPGKQFVLIMTEGALRWHAGYPAVMAEQAQAIAGRRRLHRPAVIVPDRRGGGTVRPGLQTMTS